MQARLHDGSAIDIEVHGDGPALLLPCNPVPLEGPQADEMRRYGADPALGQSLIHGLRATFRIIAFDYEGLLWRQPKPDTLTPANVAADLLAVADAAGAGRFAYYGYSWLAMVGLQLALRTDRLLALVMGGFPPLNGPYGPMLAVTRAAHEQSGGAQPGQQADEDEWSTAWLTKAQTRQFVTLYEALQGFDDRAALARITCPCLCFVGSADEIVYGQKWGGVTVSIAGPVVTGQGELEASGWDVHVLDGLDHMQAMQAAQVIPMVQPWLASHLGLRSAP